MGEPRNQETMVVVVLGLNTHAAAASMASATHHGFVLYTDVGSLVLSIDEPKPDGIIVTSVVDITTAGIDIIVVASAILAL